MGGARPADGSSLVAQGLLDRLPSVLCKAVAIDLSAAAAQALSRQAVDIDFVRDACRHLKALVVERGGQYLLEALVYSRMPDCVIRTA